MTSEPKDDHRVVCGCLRAFVSVCMVLFGISRLDISIDERCILNQLLQEDSYG